MRTAIEKRIQEILEEKTAQFEADVKSGKKKLRVPVEDYINDAGIRVRVYKKENKTDKAHYKQIPNFMLDKKEQCNIERRERILRAEQEEHKLKARLY